MECKFTSAPKLEKIPQVADDVAMYLQTDDAPPSNPFLRFVIHITPHEPSAVYSAAVGYGCESLLTNSFPMFPFNSD